jgi:murein DD-endopeptidase MepM/ murein hydrolase activator NlpD
MAPVVRRPAVRSRLVAVALVAAALALVPVFAAASAASGSVAPPAARTAERAVGATSTWTWPVGPPVRLLDPFRAPPTPYAAGHRGIDVAVATGSVVRAAADGVVSFAGPVAGRPVLSIDHGEGVVSSIEPVSASVTAGDEVAGGAAVGVVGEGGHCDGACVHFGVRVHGEYVSPMLFLGGLPRAVLRPLGG